MAFGEVWPKCLLCLFFLIFWSQKCHSCRIFIFFNIYSNFLQSWTGNIWIFFLWLVLISQFCFMKKVLSVTRAWRILLHCKTTIFCGFRQSAITSFFCYWYARFYQSPHPSTPWCYLTAWKGKKWINISLENHLALKIWVEPNGYLTNVRKISELRKHQPYRDAVTAARIENRSVWS